jgi:ubiquitin C-terminal hydrolase
LDDFPIKSFKEIQFTPFIGLQNIGQTCYMNAALQCFSNTKSLTNYFLNYDKLEYIKNNTITIFDSDEPSLAVEYLKLVRHLWCDKPNTYYAPYEFKQAVGKIDPLFKNFEANDAKDFVNFMVMRLHDELNGIDNNLVKQNILAPPTMQLNPYDKSQVLQSYLYEFQINFNSFISNCFYGTTQGEFECQNCKMQLYQYGQNMPLVKYNYQTFFFLNFPLDEVRKYILSNQMLYMKYMNTNTNPNVEVNLIDCFYYYQKDDILSCYCDRCQNINAQVLTRTKLYVAPIYLILLFNRGKGIQFKIKLTFPEQFDTNGIFINSSGIYQLYGVVKHYGDSSASGHFTAYCRSPIDGCWYHYNDAMVTPVNEQEKYIIQDNGMTYMLFYQIKK